MSITQSKQCWGDQLDKKREKKKLISFQAPMGAGEKERHNKKKPDHRVGQITMTCRSNSDWVSTVSNRMVMCFVFFCFVFYVKVLLRYAGERVWTSHLLHTPSCWFAFCLRPTMLLNHVSPKASTLSKRFLHVTWECVQIGLSHQKAFSSVSDWTELLFNHLILTTTRFFTTTMSEMRVFLGLHSHTECFYSFCSCFGCQH